VNAYILESGKQDQFLYEDMWSIIRRGQVWRGRFTNKKKDGTPYEETATISPVKDSTGRIANYVMVERDMTSEVLLQKQLLHAQKMEAIGTLAGGIAHDVNNLLQIVLGHADMLLLREGMDEKSCKSVEAIRRAAHNGADLVSRILTFSRKSEPEMRAINLSEEVRRVDELLRRTIPKMINLEMFLEDNLRMINADPSQIEQILLNLAANARDAMPEGGRLVFETGNATIREEYCRTHPEVEPGKYVLLTVSDTGQGMARGTLDRIFEPFFTTKQPGEGTGLGLSMVFGVVKNHGGHITCYSEAGVGSTFKIYFPVLAEDLQPDQATTIEMPAGGTETLLLVDDEDAVRTLGAEMLELAGYTVLAAANGREALEVYRNNRESIALVILDLVMPEMSGRKCLEELLKMNPKAEVLIASGYAANGPAKEARESGAAGFVGKPFDLKQILLAIRKILDRVGEEH
jgi:two-component system, cell cycle sensor histidine kinase and response regulator CckA